MVDTVSQVRTAILDYWMASPLPAEFYESAVSGEECFEQCYADYVDSDFYVSCTFEEFRAAMAMLDYVARCESRFAGSDESHREETSTPMWRLVMRQR